MKKLKDLVLALSAVQWIAVIFLGLITNMLYDLLKPGFSTGAGWIFTWVTLGSKSILDSAYATAAHDPTSLPIIIIFGLVSWTPLVLLALGQAVFHRRFQQLRLARGAVERQTSDERKRQLAADESTVWWLHKVFAVAGVTTAMVLFGIGTFLSHSVEVWRVFHADIKMCRPYMTDYQERAMQGRFTRMKTQDEFLAIITDLHSIAGAAGDPLPD